MTSIDPVSSLPDPFNPRGDYFLEAALAVIHNQWRCGGQIAMLIGAGLSVEAGFPAVATLTEHLLILRFLRSLHVKPKLKAGDDRRIPAYDPAVDGWVSPTSISDYLPVGLHKTQIPGLLVERRLRQPSVATPANEHLDGLIRHLTEAGNKQVIDFAREALGLGWLSLIPEAANNDPALAEALFDALGSQVRTGTTHAILAQCIAWFNINLIMTTNFDTLIEDSLSHAGMRHHSYDVHTAAPAPPSSLVRQHLSVIKLHGSRYGIRADQTIQMPMARGDVDEIIEYIDKDAIILVLGYGGNDRRVMDVLRKLLREDSHAGVRIIRVDPAVPRLTHDFSVLASSSGTYSHGEIALPRVLNLYYPESGSFLLDMFQYCAAAMPNSRHGYLSLPHNPAPHREHPVLGRDILWKNESAASTSNLRSQDHPEDRPPSVNRHHQPEVERIISAINQDHSIRAARNSDSGNLSFVGIVAGPPHCGVSQCLSQVHERLSFAYEALWCDLEEATSVGTIVRWLDQFSFARQPDLPHPPLPLDLPAVQPIAGLTDTEILSLDRTAQAIVHRVCRMRALITFDSIDDFITQRIARSGRDSERQVNEAARVVVFITLLISHFQTAPIPSQAIILIGCHAAQHGTEEECEKVKRLDELFERCTSALRKLTALTAKPVVGKPQDEDRHRLTTLNCLLRLRGTNHLDEEKVARVLRYPVRCPLPLGLSRASEDTDWKGRFFKLDPVDPDGGFGYEMFVDRDGSIGTIDQSPVAEPQVWVTADEAIKRIAGEPNEQWKKLFLLLQECALARRPRSLALMYALPSAEKYSLIDRNRPELIALIEGALRRGLLRREPGGYFWMDSALKQALLAYIEQDASRCTITHEKYRRYYERLFDQSGDVSCLNEFVYHSLQLLKPGETANNQCVILETIRCLQENAWASRSNPGVYDFVFLSLCIVDELEEVFGSGWKENSIFGTFIRELLECYEDAEDATGVEQLLPSIRPTEAREAEHHQQKNYARRLDVPEALRVGRTGIAALLRAAGLEGSNDELYERLASGRSRVELLATVSSRPVAAQVLLHRFLLRHQRNLGRLAWGMVGVGAGDHPDEREVRLAEMRELNSFGMELLARGGAMDGYETKKLWVRYRTNRARYYVIRIDYEKYNHVGINKVLWHIRQARAFAGDGAGTDGAFYEAVAWIHEAEALMWEGRYLLRRAIERCGAVGGRNDKRRQEAASAFDEVRARQDSSAFAVQQCVHTLGRCRMAVVWWREVAVLRTAIGADALKRIVCQMLTTGDRVSAEYLQAAGKDAEQAARELGYLRHMVAADHWRRVQVDYEQFRLRFYVLAVLDLVERGLADGDELSLSAVRGLLALGRSLRSLDPACGIGYVVLAYEDGTLVPGADEARAKAEARRKAEAAAQGEDAARSKDETRWKDETIADWIRSIKGQYAEASLWKEQIKGSFAAVQLKLGGPLAENVRRMERVAMDALSVVPTASVDSAVTEPKWYEIARRQADRAGADYF